MKIIFQKKNFWWLYLVLDHQKKKKFYTRIHNKYNKILEDLVFDNKKTWMYFTAYPGKNKIMEQKLTILHKYL